MKLNALLRFGVLTVLLVFVALPLSAWKSVGSVNAEGKKASMLSNVNATKASASDVPGDLSPAMLAATYSGHSGCAPTGHDFDIVVDVLDAGNNIYRLRNLLDEGEVIKARLRDGMLQLGTTQKIGSYHVSGYVQYLENPARIETHIKYDDGIGYCDDVSVFKKR